MIDVKGIRTELTDQPAHDPLGLKKEEGSILRMPQLIGVGLAAIMLYLRSFLNNSQEAGIAPASSGPQEGTDEAAPRGASGIYSMAIEEADFAVEEPASDAAVDAAVALSKVRFFGPIDAGIFVPTQLQDLRLRGAAKNGEKPPVSGSQALPIQQGGKAPVAILGDSLPAFPVENAGGGNDDGDEVDDVDETEDDDVVDPRNRAPRSAGAVYLGEYGSGLTAAIAFAQLLSQAHDPDGDILTVTNVTTDSGDLAVTARGWQFVPAEDMLGRVTFTVTVSDGEFSIEQLAYADVVENRLDGTPDDDLIIGTMGRDLISGGLGDDNILGRAGSDIIDGGEGDDHIVAGAGNDIVTGGAGNDIIFGGLGDDRLSGGTGDDELYGDEGNDLIFGDEGDDLIYGGDGDDQALGGIGADVLFGDAGDDVMDGGAGNDILHDGEGTDLLIGGEGNDTVFAVADNADDHFIGGEGFDVLSYADVEAPLVFDLAAGTVSSASPAPDADPDASTSIGTDHHEGFEGYHGGRGDDEFRIEDGSAELAGGGGNDMFTFSYGGDDNYSLSIYQIVDFEAGDRINIFAPGSSRELRKFREDFEDNIEDYFDEYAEDVLGMDEPRIKFHNDWTEDYQRTVVEVDFDRDNIVDLTLTIEGRHLFALDMS